MVWGTMRFPDTYRRLYTYGWLGWLHISIGVASGSPDVGPGMEQHVLDSGEALKPDTHDHLELIWRSWVACGAMHTTAAHTTHEFTACTKADERRALHHLPRIRFVFPRTNESRIPASVRCCRPTEVFGGRLTILQPSPEGQPLTNPGCNQL